MNSRKELESVMKYCEAMEKKTEMEQKGFIFEIHWTYARVHQGEKVILDYSHTYGYWPVQKQREDIYRAHTMKAVKAVEDYLELARSLMV
jgi:hypothetical protein